MNVKDYDDYIIFIKDVIAKKLEENPELSIRWFSSRLNWPTSLINDVFAGRRALSTSRLLEIGNYLQLNSTDLEYLIYLGLKGNSKGAVRVYFEKELQMKGNNSKSNSPQVPSSLISLDSQAVLMAIIFLRDDSNLTNIKKLLYTFPDLTEERIEHIREDLYQEKIISKKEGKIYFSNENYSNSYQGINSNGVEFMSQYSANTQRFMDSNKRQGPGQIDYKFVTIPINRIEEIKSRYTQLINWIDDTKVPAENDTTENKNIFQVGLTLFPIGDLKLTSS